MLPIALALTLSATPPLLPLHHGGLTAPQAWVAASDGQLWICWDGPLSDTPPTPGADCWSRVPLELARDAPLDPGGDLRVAFRDPDNLWIHAPLRGTWILGRDGIATPQEDAPSEAELSPLTTASCSRSGWLPTRTGGRWSWRSAPCAATGACPRRLEVRRRPTGIRATLYVEAALRRRSLAADDGEDFALDSAALLTLSLGLDRRRAYYDRLALARWRRASTERRRRLPVARSGGILGDRERIALERGQCSAWGSVR